MQQIIFRYDPKLGLGRYFKNQAGPLGSSIQYLVAGAISTKEMPLSTSDMQFLPLAHEPGTLGAPRVGVELRLYGLYARKVKLTEGVVRALKAGLVAIVGFPKVSKADFKIWVQWIDTDGPYV